MGSSLPNSPVTLKFAQHLDRHDPRRGVAALPGDPLKDVDHVLLGQLAFSHFLAKNRFLGSDPPGGARYRAGSLATLPLPARYSSGDSQENVEVVRRTMDAYNTRDLPAYLDTLSESVRFQSRFSAMDRVYRGHDDLRRYFAELDEVWSRYEMRVQRLVPSGRQVAALCHLYAVGRESDLQVEEDSAVVFTVEAGRIVRTRTPRTPRPSKPRAARVGDVAGEGGPRSAGLREREGERPPSFGGALVRRSEPY